MYPTWLTQESWKLSCLGRKISKWCPFQVSEINDDDDALSNIVKTDKNFGID